MKEIDFIPQWYKDRQKKHVSHHLQYVVIIGIFAAIVMWSFATCVSVSKAKAQINRIQESLAANEDMVNEFNELATVMVQLREKAEILEKLDHKTSIANIIGELSFLVPDNIIFKNIDIGMERFVGGAVGSGNSQVKLFSQNSGMPAAAPVRDTRFKVIISGIAAGVDDVAGLISQMENSSYFCQVVPGFSRAGKVKEFAITEFEISCYLANYTQVD
ncbi:MAG: PilN domain-containing protein [Planctomycetota bacterium]|jgi:hypothetical protein